MLSLCNTMITLRILPTGNLLFSGKQRTCRGKLVDKENLCLPLNFPLAYHMHAGNLEDKGKISLLHEHKGNTRFTSPPRTKESEAIMVLLIIIVLFTRRTRESRDPPVIWNLVDI